MRHEVHAIGAEGAKVVVIEQFAPEPEALVEAAAETSRMRQETETYYPGVRFIIEGANAHAESLIEDLLERAAPLLGQAFGVKSFMPVESSFCLVTTAPNALKPVQRLPHYDRSDPGFLALLLYLGRPEHGGTSFYRHRASGFERISPERVRGYVTARAEEDRRLGEAPARYFAESDARFERIAAFDALPNRLLIYQGSALHSGTIPDDFAFSPDPRQGRLTLNMFVQAL